MKASAGGTDSARRAVLANVRQALAAPVEGLVGYGDLICERVAAGGFEQFQPDANRILAAARDLADLVNRLLDEETSRTLFATQTAADAEKGLRHDLRTPINAIKGYGEMLLEDLDDLGEQTLRSDLEKLLAEADRLLAQLGSIVDFSRGNVEDAAEALGADAIGAALANLMDEIPSADDAPPPEETGYILVVDDIESNRDLLSRRLVADGHRVATAGGGEEALAMLAAADFDLVLLDLMMPGINGFEVLARMKRGPNLKGVPVVMVLALDDTASVIRCIEAGADDYLPKPFNPTLLRARIKSGLEEKQWMDEEKRQKRFIREAFSRFVAPAVVNELIAAPERLSLGGKRQELTVVFTDLADFTTLIENEEPANVLPVLNRYLDSLCQIVLDHGGTIDKIVGDALHAFFGAPLEQPDPPGPGHGLRSGSRRLRVRLRGGGGRPCPRFRCYPHRCPHGHGRGRQFRWRHFLRLHGPRRRGEHDGPHGERQQAPGDPGLRHRRHGAALPGGQVPARLHPGAERQEHRRRGFRAARGGGRGGTRDPGLPRGLPPYGGRGSRGAGGVPAAFRDIPP